MITLQPITDQNWYTFCQLTLSDAQQAYMEPNAISLLQAVYEPTLEAHAIYEDETMVGFLMYNTVLEELNARWVYRIMVDHAQQGKGIGRQATELMLEEMGQLGTEPIVVGYHPDNTGAHRLYESLGFVDEGNRFGREMAVIRRA
ncbi:GNAT family N-acetyltransferase [Exiguobacterium aurantiacum]|uniref:GNAT family N-acetyltransferase n=1 Tax=Exiguobacterium aurantiacum TaxID=33987 RepID=A0ABY5FNJ1_9BACL|nr:GNAT family N-acetyltransferase [Exiguobacterium aurantiacum]UTT43117.1 GNAT family N-acetyltransferase [Exiguobacterium aurantiacum]